MKGREFVKKLISAAAAAVLVFCVVLTLCACGSDKNNGTVTDNTSGTDMVSEKVSEMMTDMSEMMTDVSEKISEKISEMTPDVSDGTIPETSENN